MYIPCQIMDTSSLGSQASSVTRLRGFCCPFLHSRQNHASPRPRSIDTFQRDLEDPETVFSRHRAAVIAGHRFLTNNDGIWDLQNIAPPLPQVAPPPLPPRKLSSFFPPMEPFNVHRTSVVTSSGQIQLETHLEPSGNAASSSKKARERKQSKENRKRLSSSTDISPPALPSLTTNINPQGQGPRGSNGSIACPYLSPIDVAATSWEWDFGNNETLRSHMSFSGLNSMSGSAVSNRVNIWGDPPVVKKGLLKQQREKMWSRWKERYFILTRDYLHCFRRLRNVYRFQVTLSAMGQFIYKLRLANIEDIRYDTYRSISRISITLRHEATIYLRTSDDNVEALYHWFTLLQECICMSKIRRQALRVFNSSSEEDTTSGSDPSRFSGINTQDEHSQSSAYTLTTSSPLSGSSGQSEMLEIYKRVGSFRLDASAIVDEIKKGSSVINRISSASNNNKSNSVKSTTNEQPRRGSGTSCGYYFGERPTTLLSRPQAQNHSNFNRFQLPVLDSMSDIDNHEINDMFESLPKRCANPTKEMEGSSTTTQSGTRNSYTVEPRTSEERPSKEPSPSLDDSEDYDEIFDMMEDNTNNTNVSPPRCESRVTLRDFVKTPWRSISACLPAQEPPPQDIDRDDNSSRTSAFPVPSRRPPVPQRSVSSFSRPVQPPAGVFGGRKVLPTPWTKNNPTLQIGKGAAFSRSNVIVCPSKLSADVTYLRRV